jgi:hypothetical protein
VIMQDQFQSKNASEFILVCVLLKSNNYTSSLNVLCCGPSQ